MGQILSRSYGAMLYNLLDHTVDEISVAEAAESDSLVLFLDARSLEEFEVSHIKNAKWIGYDDFDLTRVEGIPKETAIVIYCSVGFRSEKVGEKLESAGFSNVQNLYGSIFEWVNQGEPVYTDQGIETLRVHVFSKEWGQWLIRGEKVY